MFTHAEPAASKEVHDARGNRVGNERVSSEAPKVHVYL